MKNGILKKIRFYKYLSGDGGAVAVEFAMISVLFLTIIFGTFETGRLLWAKTALQYAVGNTTRYAVTHPTAADSDLIAYATTSMGDIYSDSSGLTVTITRSVTAGIKQLDVYGSYNYAAIVPFLPASWNQFVLTSDAKTFIPAS